MDSIDKIWCNGEDWCPVTVTAGVMSKKWHPVIISRLLVKGEMGFAELKDHIPDISSKVLSDDLQELEDNGIVRRAIVSERPFRVEYSLTEQGQSLEPIVDAMDDWGTEYLETETVAP